jgi:hypothetical protein
MRTYFPIGARVRVVDGSGLDSNKVGTIIAPQLDSRGIPKVIGAYHPFRHTGPMAERMIRTDAGEVILMFTACLTVEDN